MLKADNPISQYNFAPDDSQPESADLDDLDRVRHEISGHFDKQVL